METYQNIRSLRIKCGMSQEELAKKTGYTDRSSIAKIEAGKVDLSESKISLFAKALNVSPSFLMGLEEDEYGNYDPVLVGERIKSRREKEEISRRTIELCTGIPFDEYEKYENGTGGRIPRSIFSAIATMLETSPEVLIYGTASEIDPHTVLKIDSKTMSDLYNLVVGYQSLDEEGQSYIRRSIEMAAAIYPAKKKKNKEK